LDLEKIRHLIRELIIEIGEDPDREGLKETPLRVAKAWEYLSSGYRTNIKDVIKNAIFSSEANNMIIARDIEVYSLCEHHMLPFYGKCHIGYIAQNKIIGVSKLCRIMDTFARRLQIQERLTTQIAYAIKNAVNAVGVGVVMECRHLCMMMRGVEKQNSLMTTSSVLGCFHSDQPSRLEFLSLIGFNHL
jgi:GTP cyclohydrolase I